MPPDPKMQARLDAGIRRDVETLVALQRESNIVIETLFKAVPDGRIDGAYDKFFEKMHDPEFPLRMLPPYVGSSDTEFHTLVRLLRERLPAWGPVTAR